MSLTDTDGNEFDFAVSESLALAKAAKQSSKVMVINFCII
jgi:hypothetical protein